MTLPFFEVLKPANKVLLAGAGGGYDIFSGLPLYFGLQAAGKQVYLANLSFSVLPSEEDQRLTPSLFKVTANTQQPFAYFPELFLSQWFQTQQQEVPIYCFEITGVKPLLEDYQVLIQTLSIDTLILVDGGTDSLMRGDEVELGTPVEDIASIAAVNALDLERKLMVCLGFGVDAFHGICHAQFLEAVAELTQSDGYLGLFSLVQEMPEVQKYQEAVEFVFQAMPPRNVSIVSSSILSALAGHYGNYHATRRTRGSRLWINPLMPVYWCFQLSHVAQRILYLEALKETENYLEVEKTIATFRQRCQTIKNWKPIPV